MCRRLAVVDQHISVVIKDLCVQNRIGIGSFIGDRCKSGSDVDIADTFRNTAERKRLVHIIFNDRGDVEIVLYIFVTLSRTYDLSQGAYGTGVDGLLNRIAHRGGSDIPVIGVVDFLAALIFVRFVHDCGSKRNLPLVKARSVCREDLETGSRLLGS